ncbi:MAG: heterodisulfide reductase-related iron-sulfur binding cluster, partial [Dehalococcoidia bacterium]
VEEGYDIVVPGPTCAFMLKQEYPTLTGGSPEAKKVAEHSFEMGEYLKRLDRSGRLDTEFVNGAGKIAFHAPCHTRAQFMGSPSSDILSLLPDSSVEEIERCSGHDGTWGIKKRYHDMSLEVGARLFSSIQEAEADVIVTDCPLASLQIHHATGRRPVHTVQVLREAYGIT